MCEGTHRDGHGPYTVIAEVRLSYTIYADSAEEAKDLYYDHKTKIENWQTLDLEAHEE